MHIKEDLIINRYNISDEKIDTIKYIIETYLEKIDYFSCPENKSISEEIGYLGVASELLSVVECDEYFYYVLFKIIKSIRDNIEIGNLRSISLHEGLSNIGVFLTTIAENTGSYKKFLHELNHLICITVEEQYKSYIFEGNICTQNFDIICGFSGVGNYLLHYSNDCEVQKALQLICKYLVRITEYIYVEKKRFPGWYICPDNEHYLDAYAMYEGGYINYSVSHGSGGILLFLVNAYERGILVEGLKDAINRIVKEYVVVNSLGNGQWWAGIISKAAYGKGLLPNLSGRQSWCYGDISVLLALYKSSKVLELEQFEIKIYNELTRIAKMDIKQYHLNSPIICHGYAGTLTIFRTLYEETNEPVFFDTMMRLLSFTLNSFNNNSLYGFRNVISQTGISLVYNDDNSFLNGASGIIMELLAWVKEKSYFESMLLLKS